VGEGIGEVKAGDIVRDGEGGRGGGEIVEGTEMVLEYSKSEYEKASIANLVHSDHRLGLTESPANV
jgi:hypothetical protein